MCKREVNIGVWEDFKARADNCVNCTLYKNRKQAVIGDGNKLSPLMLIAEAPGKGEDVSGIPFTGKAGQAMNAWLEEIEIFREYVYIANTLKCRPWEISEFGREKNRTPTEAEVDACFPLLEAQVQLVQPKFIICIGGVSGKKVLGENWKGGITKSRGVICDSVFGIPCLATYHPAYILRQVEGSVEYKTLVNTFKDDIKKGVEYIKALSKKEKDEG